MLVRTWNLFSGNTLPPGRHAYVREMVELMTADGPGAVCLQEVPAWALPSVGHWAQMTAFGSRSRHPKTGPVQIPAAVGRTMTRPHHGLFRSAFAGQGNAILVRAEAEIRETKVMTLNTNPFCEEQGARLGLNAKLTRRWQKERRICQAVHIELPGRQRLLIANVHLTSLRDDPRLADAELNRAVGFVERSAELEEIVILAGDFNLGPEQSGTVARLLAAEIPYTISGATIDHILVRGVTPTRARVWPDEERRRNGRLLSDHPPVEVDLPVE